MAKEYLDKDGLLYFWQKIKNTFALVSHTHTVSNISDFPSTMTPSSHTHGNITNDGKLQTSDVDIANGDKLVIADSSNSSKMARASLAFDGSTTTKVLAKKGTWIDLPSGASPSSTTPAMDGTASVGTETAFARGDHVHPTDTSRAPNTTFTAATSSVSGADGLVPGPDYDAVFNNSRLLSSSGDWRYLAIQTSDSTPAVVSDASTTSTLLALTVSNADQEQSGFMSIADKVKLDSLGLGNGRVFYGTCSTGSGTAAKVVTCPSYDALTDGDILVVTFSETNSASSATLNVNSKGAKAVKQMYNGGPTDLKKNSSLNGTQAFVYDGTYWLLLTANARLSLAVTTHNSMNAVYISDGGATSLYAIATSAKGAANGLCPLDSNGLVDSSYLPSYVDDVIEAYPRSGQTELSSTWLATGSASGTVITPETGKIYVLMADSTNYSANSQFRWGGTAYVKLADGGVSSVTNAEIDTIVAS